MPPPQFDTGNPSRSLIRLELTAGHLVAALLLILYPFGANDFFIVQIGAQSLLLGTVALSLMLLAGYGGMVSLSQMTVAGMAGYFIAILGTDSYNLGLGWPWWIVVPGSILCATIIATMIGIISVRTEGIYTIMITLAIGVALYYLCNQNYAVFNGFTGFSGLKPPAVFGIDWRAPLPFYYLSLAIAAAAYLAVSYFERSTFGLALQAIRDNPRRMHALGYDVTLHRIVAHVFAGFLAAVGGVMLVWYNGRISPGTIGVGELIDILIIAVIGGLRRPIGPFVGAIVFVLIGNFAIDLIDRERFNMLIGFGFLIIVLFSPDGLLGLWDKLTSMSRDARAEEWRR